MQMRRLVLADKLPVETVARRFGVHHSTVRRALVAVYTPVLPHRGSPQCSALPASPSLANNAQRYRCRYLASAAA